MVYVRQRVYKHGRKLGDEASEICSRDNLIYTLKKMDRFDDAICCCRNYIQLSENSQNKVCFSSLLVPLVITYRFNRFFVVHWC